ncbi:DHHW family protein [Neobacillus sp.]|uniref:DHHW family protein n=1 Tax=Neobacillus sp. TaxID=2675273 RepID=UPI00289EEB5A|nr:DHHW family protein [Neobacillus sp.]
MKKFNNILFTLVFLGIIFSVGTISFLKQDRNISSIENRTLAQRPDLTKQSFLSGEYFKNFETYFSDQLAGRDEIIKVYTEEQLFLNKTIINNIVVAKDNWLLYNPSTENVKKEMDKSLSNLNNLADTFKGTGVEFYFAAAPYKMNILKDIYPSYINEQLGVQNQKYFMSHLPSSYHGINLYQYFKQNYSEPQLKSMYFKTDHHWNIEGAFAGYQEIIKQMSAASKQFKAKPVNKENLSLVCNHKSSFVGTLNLRLYSLIDTNEEKICYYDPVFNPKTGKVTVQTGTGDALTNINQIYGAGFNKKEVLYGDLFTWDLAEINYEYQNTGNDLHLLVLKDSYANPIQPFIAEHFNKTSVLDIRHYHKTSVAQYIKDNKIDIVLFLYNDSNLTGAMYEF